MPPTVPCPHSPFWKLWGIPSTAPHSSSSCPLCSPTASFSLDFVLPPREEAFWVIRVPATPRWGEGFLVMIPLPRIVPVFLYRAPFPYLYWFSPPASFSNPSFGALLLPNQRCILFFPVPPSKSCKNPRLLTQHFLRFFLSPIETPSHYRGSCSTSL